MFSPDTPLKDYARLEYFPDRLAGPAHAKSREEYLRQISKLNRHFQEWLKELLETATTPEDELLYAPREVRLGDLSDAMLKFAMAREVEPKESGGKNNSPGTANKLFRHIKSLWAHAGRSEHAGGPILIKRICLSKPYREAKRKARAWYPEQIEAIVFAAATMPGFVGEVRAGDFWTALILVNISTGVRISALMDIATSDWNEANSEVLVRAETQKHREDENKTLYDSANDALRRLMLKERSLKTLFGDWPWDGDKAWRILRKHLRKLLVKAGLFEHAKDVTRRDLFHKFRRSAATAIAIKQGLAAAQHFLGHSSPTVTEGYVDETHGVRLKMSDVMDDPGAKIMQLRLFDQAG